MRLIVSLLSALLGLTGIAPPALTTAPPGSTSTASAGTGPPSASATAGRGEDGETPVGTAADAPVVLTDVRIPMDDGVRLSADVYLPPGTPTDGSATVPCLVELTPYRKEDRAAEGAALLPPNGFGLVEVDARGTGGSEGEYDIVFSLREQWDTAAVIDWAAEDAGFCTDKVGMFGGSYSGIIQYLTASLPPSRAPKHLVAIAPQRAYGDLYRDIVYQGGQLISSFGLIWSGGTSAYYTEPPTDVNTPAGRSAWLDHLTRNDAMLKPYLEHPYADATWTSDNSDTPYAQRLYADSSVLSRIENLHVPTLHLAGWFDAFTRGQLQTFQQALDLERSSAPGCAAGTNAGTSISTSTSDHACPYGPNYLIVGPWNHGGTHFTAYPRFRQMLLDWYDYWLADGPRPDWFGRDRVLYEQMGTGALDDDTGTWRWAESWPPPADHTRFYLRSDGSLTTDPPARDEPAVSSVFDPTTGVAEYPSRWDNAAGVPQTATDQRLDGERGGPTFQTAPLDEPMAITGPILLRLHAATTGLGVSGADVPGNDLAYQVAPPWHDTDFVVKVSDVAPDGTAALITQGYLRASHRAVDLDRSQVVDGEVVVPFHPHTRASLDPPPAGEVRDYLVEVWPTAKTFAAGHRIRLDVYTADTPNHLNLLRPAYNELSLRAAAPSYLLLPLAPAGQTK